jgi:phenylalanine-4-hydroxylase
MRTGIVQLEADHPGFNDQAYRVRRDEIADLASHHHAGDVPPRVEYTPTETATWGAVYSELRQLYPTHACREYRDAFQEIGFHEVAVPQLADVDAFLLAKTGFRIVPVAGLVSARDFLGSLARRQFPSTQYLRHHSVPHYTPEPDICHDLLGHVPMLATQSYADLTQKIGEATLGAPDDQIEQFSRLYWYTIEFGLVEEQGQLRAYGAGLLSSFGELSHALAGKPGEPEVRPFDARAAGEVPNPITRYQPLLWAVPSLGAAFELVSEHIERIRRAG